MPKNIKGTCALTLEECDLKESHIYPKFIFDYLLQKGGKRFRCLGNPTKVLQDGVKRHLLGGNAEQEFSKREKWFAEKLFIPFCNGQMNNSKLIYHDELYYFCVSLLWRVLYWVKDSIRGERLISKCNQAFEEWRIFLNGGNLPPNFNRIYLMPITPLLFDSMPAYRLKQITQVVKLIRSKGIGLFIHVVNPQDSQRGSLYPSFKSFILILLL